MKSLVFDYVSSICFPIIRWVTENAIFCVSYNDVPKTIFYLIYCVIKSLFVCHSILIHPHCEIYVLYFFIIICSS